MSKFQKSVLALAVAAAFGLPAAASAATLSGPGTNGAPAQVVYYTVAAGAADISSANYTVAIQANDNLVGRTTGLGVRITLPTGVSFAAAPAVASGSGLGTGAGGSVTVGSATANTLIINVTPNSGGLDLSGPVFTLSGVDLAGASALASVGGSIAATMVMYDPVTATTLNTTAATLVVSVNPVKITFTPSASPAKIDVGTTGAGNTGHLSKVLFSQTGVVNGTDVPWFDAGTVAATASLTAIDGTTGLSYTGPVGGDTLTTALTTTGGTFAPFASSSASVWLTTSSCSSALAVGPSSFQGTVSADGNSVKFGAQPYATSTYNVCVVGNGTTTLLAGSVGANTVFGHGTVSTAPQSGTLQPLAYNGPVATVYTFNPGSNSNQQSFLRVSNTSAVAGPVTITGVDDAGHKATGSVSFTLGAGQSIQLNSTDLENGNTAKGLTGALGTGTGKWILTVTGQMATMEVTNLNRNNSTGTLNNLGTPVDGAH